MTVAAILKHKGYHVLGVDPMRTIAEVVQVLSSRRIGAVVVRDSAAGIVRLSKLHAPTFGANLRQMQQAGLTFAAADQSDRLYTMTRQRLRQVWRPITEQIGAVL